MWADVQLELTEILSSRLFPTLVSDPGYWVMLRNAGLTTIPDYQNGKLDPGWAKAQSDWRKSVPLKTSLRLHSSTTILSPEVRSRLQTAARMCAQLFINELEALGAVRERRAKAVVLEGATTIYRISDSKMDNRTRHWWFSENLLRLAAAQGAKSKQSVREWLRDWLAVSYNFGACDQLSKIVLTGNAAIPAIEAMGLPMPKYQPVTRDPQTRMLVHEVPEVPKDYWSRLGETFRGQKTQYFLPFVPPDRIKEASWPRSLH